jgi:hypothetical protein
MSSDLVFVLVVEAGNLEGQAALLIESIRGFTGPFRDSPIWVVQPRPGRAISQTTLDIFFQHNVVFVSSHLNKTWQNFGYANKVYAAAFVEDHVADTAGTLVFLGSDTLFLHPPDQLVLRADEVVAVRPVEGTRTLASPADQPLSDYWSLLLQIAGVAPSQVWDVMTAVCQHRIRAYFQGDMLAVRPSRGLFRQWRANLERCSSKDISNRFHASTPEYCNLEQALFAATVMANTSRLEVRILDWRYHYPLPQHDALSAATRATFLDDLVTVHYHKAFYDLNWMKKLDVREPVKSWLLQRLPLKRAA